MDTTADGCGYLCHVVVCPLAESARLSLQAAPHHAAVQETSSITATEGPADRKSIIRLEQESAINQQQDSGGYRSRSMQPLLISGSTVLSITKGDKSRSGFVK